MEDFEEIYARAVVRHGGEEEVDRRLPAPKTKRQLAAAPDHRYLAEMARCVFRSGFVWRVVEAKWPGFEEAFSGFSPDKAASLSNQQLERLVRDERIIRHRAKIASVRDNAIWMREVAAEHGSFARFVSRWPDDDIVGLWLVLKKQGSRLGGDTGPRFLRGVGKDTFLLSREVADYLVDQRVVTKKPTGIGELRSAQEAFLAWQQESELPFCQISRVISLSWGEVHE